MHYQLEALQTALQELGEQAMEHDAENAAENEAEVQTQQPHVISLPENTYWLDNFAFGSQLVVRSCYQQLWKLIQKVPDRRIAVIGSPGIGKSWFLFYCMCELAAAEIPFLYIVNRGREVAYCIFRDGQREEYSSHTTREVSTLLHNPDAYILIDERPSIGMLTTPGKAIVSSSPDREKYNDFLNEDNGGLQLYMSVWNDEELEMKRLQHATNSNCKLTAEQVRTLVDIAGRVPRYIFRDKPFQEVLDWNKEEIVDAVQMKPVEKMLEAVGHLTAADKNTSHRILAIEVDRKKFSRTGLAFHSRYTKKVALDQLTNISHFKLFNYYRATQGSLKGNIFEWYAHRKLAAGARVLERFLDGGSRDERELDIPAANHSIPTFERAMIDLLRAGENDYLVPADETFESVDAVCLPRFYQMTVRRTHPIKLNNFANFLINLSARSPDPIEGEIPFVLIVPREQLGNFTYATALVGFPADVVLA